MQRGCSGTNSGYLAVLYLDKNNINYSEDCETMRTRELPLVKQIKKCEGLTPKQKARAIDRIGIINRDKNLARKCNFVPGEESLFMAFVWCYTPWGLEYWRRINRILLGEQK
jgi:hypothetical protein